MVTDRSHVWTLLTQPCQSYLSDDEFSSVLGMTRDQFYTLRHGLLSFFSSSSSSSHCVRARAHMCVHPLAHINRAWKQTQVKKKAGLL